MFSLEFDLLLFVCFMLIFAFFFLMKIGIGGIADLMENIFLFSFMFFYPTTFPTWAINLASAFTIVKYSLLFSSFVFIILGILKAVFFGSKSHQH